MNYTYKPERGRSWFRLDGQKEDYREEVQADQKPTIHHIAERKLWLAQREAGTNEVWQYAYSGDPHSPKNWSDIPADMEINWNPYLIFRVKPKSVKSKKWKWKLNNEIKLMIDISIQQLYDQIEIMKLNMPSHIEFYRIFAKIHRAKFEALTNAGYSEAQALEICGKF